MTGRVSSASPGTRASNEYVWCVWPLTMTSASAEVSLTIRSNRSPPPGFWPASAELAEPSWYSTAITS